jgi:hypothetical protein
MINKYKNIIGISLISIFSIKEQMFKLGKGINIFLNKILLNFNLKLVRFKNILDPTLKKTDWTEEEI